MKKRFLFFLILIPLAGFLAIAGCSKKQAVRQDYRSFNVEEAFTKANAHLEKKEYDNARELLLEIKSRDASGQYAPLAQLRMADTFLRQEEVDSAIDEYEKFLDLHPENKYASYAQYQIAMIYYGQITDTERGYGAAQRALDEFEKLMELYPRNPYKGAVEMRMEKCIDTLAGYEFMVGEFYFNQKAYPGALARLETIIEKYPDYRKLPQVLYMTAISYKAVGKREQAEHYLGLLSSKYPENALIKKAQKELGK